MYVAPAEALPVALKKVAKRIDKGTLNATSPFSFCVVE
jgi:hypothetical protein